MVAVQPVTARVVEKEWVDRVPSPAYDSLSAQERIAFRAENPLSYLHVTRSPQDEPASSRASDRELVEAGRESLDHLLRLGVFTEPLPPSYYVYRLQVNDHEQTAVVAEVPVEAFAEGRIRPHEDVQTARVDLLKRHTDVVRAASSPVALAFRSSHTVRNAISTVVSEPPMLDFSDRTLRQTIWRVDDPAFAEAVELRLADEPLYIIDGHHRAAAALAHEANGGGAVRPMLAALFPDESLRLLGFNRLVHDLGGQTPAEVVSVLSAALGVVPLDELAPPPPGSVVMVLDGASYLVDLGRSKGATEPEEVLEALDAVALQRRVLEPLLGIAEPGDTDRMTNLHGGQPLDVFAARVAERGGVGFLLAPMALNDLFTLADAGLTLPPKSTYFTPKVRSGIFLRQYEA